MHFNLPERPSRLLLALQEGYCNLKCPMCYVHSPDNGRKVVRGIMPLKQMTAILDQFPDPKPTICPITWAEPLMIKDFDRYLVAIKERGFPISLNTNGLLLDDDLARFMVEIGLDSVFVSIDAHCPETLERVRGIRDLEKIHEAVHMLLRAREEGPLPRIGVSFLVQGANAHERDDFVRYWLDRVDAVRVSERLDDNFIDQHITLPNRFPCGSLYDSLAVNHQGEAILCCLDAFSDVGLGNVLEKGCQTIWQGRILEGYRTLHEKGRWSELPLCAGCDAWANYEIVEEVENGVLVRRSPVTTFYNNLDRLGNWRRDGFDKRYQR